MRISHDKHWNEKFAKLVAFKRETGHCRVPSQRSSLGTWVRSQRDAYRKNEKTLPGQRAARLEALGFEWEAVRGNVGWEGRYAELAAYQQQHGHCNVLRGYPANRQLERWVNQQRGSYKKETLSLERVARLNDIGFAWTSRAPPPSASSPGSNFPNVSTPKSRARAQGGGTTRRRTSDPLEIEERTDDERTLLKTQLKEATTRISELTQQLAAASAETSELQQEAKRTEATNSDLREDAARLRSSVQALTQELERARDVRVPANGEDGACADAGYTPFIVADWRRGGPAARNA